VEAVGALQEALGSVDRLGAEERDSRYPDLILRQAKLFHFLGRSSDIVELLRSKRLRHAPMTGPCYFMLAQAHSVLGNREEAAHNANRAVEEATRGGDDSTLGKAHTVLAREAYWFGEPLRGIEHAREAVILLQGPEERHWLGIAYWLLGRHYGLMGEFDSALQAEACAHDIAATIDDRQLQSHIAWTTGDLQAIRGDWETAIETCKRALELSTDPLNTANALGQLGAAYLENGDSVQAIPFLEQSVAQFSGFRAGQARGWFTIILGEAYFVNDQLERAQELTLQGLEILQNSRYRRGIGWAHRTLGRIARARGLFPKAATHFGEALRTFDSVLARFEVARTHLALAELAHVEEKVGVTASHLDEAHRLFTSLRVRKYAEQTDQIARALGVQISVGPIA
jgi:tetratricopeptide (TPR) repeat protein